MKSCVIGLSSRAGSELAAYAVRALDGDPDGERLHELLYEIDQLVERVPSGPVNSVSLGGELPPVVYSLLEVLPQFEGDDLESQLQTYDTFLAICSPAVRSELSALLTKAAAATTNATSRARIEQAARAVARGDRAAEPYDHAESMRKYREEHRRSFGQHEEWA